jgi:hypothetical protein
MPAAFVPLVVPLTGPGALAPASEANFRGLQQTEPGTLSSSSMSAPQAGSSCRAEPEVELVQRDGVTLVVVKCRCGDVIEVECKLGG